MAIPFVMNGADIWPREGDEGLEYDGMLLSNSIIRIDQSALGVPNLSFFKLLF